MSLKVILREWYDHPKCCYNIHANLKKNTSSEDIQTELFCDLLVLKNDQKTLVSFFGSLQKDHIYYLRAWYPSKAMERVGKYKDLLKIDPNAIL
jgi:hypothetical protein